MMNLQKSRWLSAGAAALTVALGGICKFFLAPGLLSGCLWVLCILSAITAVAILARGHRCPHCGKFVPITGNYPTCIHCDAPLTYSRKKEEP